jgi:hypothetical protein
MDVDESFEQSPKPVLSDMDTDSPAVLPAQFPEAGAYYSGSDEEDYEDMRVIPDERITRRRSARISGVF